MLWQELLKTSKTHGTTADTWTPALKQPRPCSLSLESNVKTKKTRVGGIEKWVRLPERFLFLPSVPSWHRTGSTFLHVKVTAIGKAEGEKREEGGREKKTPGEQNMAAPPTTTTHFPHGSTPFLPFSVSSFSPPFLLFICTENHPLRVNSPGNDKRLSSDSPLRDCKTTHSSLNHRPLNPQTSDRDLIPWVIMTLKGGIIKN